MPTSPMNSVIDHLRRAALRDRAGLGDRELLGCFIERHDEAAFAALVQRHGPMVWGVCRRLLSHHDAEDAFQANFLVLVRKAASIVPRGMVGNWLYGVAHQTALQARRTDARRRAREVQVTVMPDTEAVQQDHWPDVQPLLDQELSRMPDKSRAVLVLCDLEGRTRKEVARQLGVPEGTVAGRLARARAMLAKRLARYDLAVSGGTLAVVLAQNAASAGVPTTVVSSTIKAASLFAAGHAAAGVVSAKAAALTEGVLKAMLLNKLKVATGVLFALSILVAGTGVLLLRVQAADPAQRSEQRSTQPAAEGKPQGPERREMPVWKERAVLDASGAYSVAFTRDGKLLASGGNQSQVFLWEAKEAKLKQKLAWDQNAGWVWAVNFSPDGKLLVTGSVPVGEDVGAPIALIMWDVATGKPKTTLMDKGSGVLCLAFSPDGKVLVSGHADKAVRVWDLTLGKVKWVLKGHGGEVKSVAFSPDGKMLASGSFDRKGPKFTGEVRFWNPETGKLEQTFIDQSPTAVESLAFSPDGRRLAVASTGLKEEKDQVKGRSIYLGHVSIYDVAKKNLQWRATVDGGVHSVTFSPDGKILASGNDDRTVTLWEAESGKCRQKLQGHGNCVWAVAFSPDSASLASAAWDMKVRLWHPDKK
jgi:RNA polymerase sigma factor (sigma-70 family)